MSFVSIYSLSLYFAVPIAEEASMQVPKVIDESFSHSDKNQLKALIDSTVKGLRENEMPNLAVNRISHYNQFVFKAVMRTLNEIGTNKR